MTRAYKIFRAILVTLLTLVVVVPTVLYILLSTPWCQSMLKDMAEGSLTELLGTEVKVQRVDVAPFNRLRVVGLSVKDDYDSTALRVSDIAARFELMYLLRTGRICVDYVALDSLSVNLYRKSKTEPLNIDGIIRKLSKKEPNKKPTRLNFAINTVMIRDSKVSYDVLSEPRKAGRFDPAHIAAADFNMVAYLPRISNDSVRVDLERLSLRDVHSGFTVKNLAANGVYTPRTLSVKNLTLELPNTLLKFGPLSARYANAAEIGTYGSTRDVNLALLQGSYISPSDAAAFVPALSEVSNRYYISLEAQGSLRSLALKELKLDDRQSGFSLEAHGAAHSLMNADSLTISNAELQIKALRGSLAWIPSLLSVKDRVKADELLRHLGTVSATVKASGSLKDLEAKTNITSDLGGVIADAALSRGKGNGWSVDGVADVDGFDLGTLLGNERLGRITASVDGTVDINGKKFTGSATADVPAFSFDGHTFRNIKAEGNMTPDGDFNGLVAMADSAGTVDLRIEGSTRSAAPRIAVAGSVRDLQMEPLGVKGKYEPYNLTVDLDADLSGRLNEWLKGHVDIRGLRFTDNAGKTLLIKKFRADADNTAKPNSVTVESDFLNGSISGSIHPGTFWNQCRDIVGHVFPALTGYNHLGEGEHKHDLAAEARLWNDFDFDLEIADAENLSSFFNLSVQIVYPVSINGMFEYAKHGFNITVDAPYLQQGDKIIENTALHVGVDGVDGNGTIYVTSTIPTQKGIMAVTSNMTAANNRLDTKINWQMEREKPIDGTLSFSTLVDRDAASNQLIADVAFNPGQINFGDATWEISPSHITVRPNHYAVSGFRMKAGDQSLEIDGEASANPDSEMLVRLQDLELISIFETLDINKALIGGLATGTFHAREVLSGEPQLWCDNLTVKNIGYNYCTLGDGKVKAWWDNTKKAFSLDADITEPGGKLSHIYGDIVPANEELDIHFDADHVKVGFMKPFMSAFADDVSGYASGHARLYGTFKYIDLEGDLYADSLGLNVGFTNTWYYATDSVHIRPGLIDIKNITMSDRYGNTALLNGYVKHNFFHDPEFMFKLTDARQLLVYDVTAKKSPDWYGRVFGNGGALIKGAPGYVNIDVNMTTTEGSTFTFVLSDTEEADDYTFITFRNRNQAVITDSIIEVDRLPAAVREYRDRMLAKAAQADAPSDYNMNIQVDITPAASIIIVMDPVGGDRIKSYGNGNMRMTYQSNGNELRMYGNYVIERGSYNFTLQDIIVKDFTIKEGSSIAFTGDPYSARLDIKALYSVNANLSDLDESFLQDKDLNSTNVPVNAVLMAQGDMRQPDISFDLDFPTLNSDIYRKVRSIVSTDDMMNRQIIYLLALNRFYTPEYMSTTKGNELFSVASSTIASQLSSMLGKLSDNWSIAPNLRSDRGDFSDVEVDVALSSNLLNNRLRLNGNFGYRDKSLNTNQFIGDFDIEYLLNRRGSWRLKAYNRYNDQNYYLRTAQTTQGVGVMFKRDFDKMFNFLKPKRREAPAGHKPAADTLHSVRPDTTPAPKTETHASPSVPADNGDFIKIRKR